MTNTSKEYTKMCNQWITYVQPIYRSDMCYGGNPHCIKWEHGGTGGGMVEVCIVCGQATAELIELPNGCYERKPR